MWSVFVMVVIGRATAQIQPVEHGNGPPSRRVAAASSLSQKGRKCNRKLLSRVDGLGFYVIGFLEQVVAPAEPIPAFAFEKRAFAAFKNLAD